MTLQKKLNISQFSTTLSLSLVFAAHWLAPANDILLIIAWALFIVCGFSFVGIFSWIYR